jgi:hypothetical protein
MPLTLCNLYGMCWILAIVLGKVHVRNLCEGSSGANTKWLVLVAFHNAMVLIICMIVSSSGSRRLVHLSLDEHISNTIHS